MVRTNGTYHLYHKRTIGRLWGIRTPVLPLCTQQKSDHLQLWSVSHVYTNFKHRLWKLWDQSTLFSRESLFRRARRDACFDCFDDRVYYVTSDSGNNEEANRRTERGCAAMGLRRQSGRHYECKGVYLLWPSLCWRSIHNRRSLSEFRKTRQGL
jgi:hypothetical protein